MLIIENPLKLLIIALLVMICLLLFFKFMDLLDAKKKKAASKKDKKDDSAKETKEEKQPIAKDEEPVYDPKTSTNYLYDRFVMCPTTDDAMVCENKICDSFLSEDKYKQIRNKKVDIKVNPVESYDSMSNKANIYRKIQELTNNNRSEKERLLDEFNHLSKEMKLLLIENIMQKID